jgi:hypothetical protein
MSTDLRWWRWWRVVDGLIISIGLHGADACTSLASAHCHGRHVDLLQLELWDGVKGLILRSFGDCWQGLCGALGGAFI